MDKQRKKQIRRYLSWGLIALLVAALAVMPLVAETGAAEDGPQASILSTHPEVRTIETQLIGGGQLAGGSTEAITIPAEIKLTGYLVGNGDTVRKGDPLARVDPVSVMTALEQVQETLDYLAEEIADLASATQTQTLTAHAGGLVKILYAEEGADVRSVMLEHGALAVLSLDSRMSVAIQRKTELAPGDTVCVTLPDDTQVEGRVESSAGDTLTVTIQDQDYPLGQQVTVSTEDGTRIGSGQLEIHSPWRATAQQGIIKKGNVKEGDSLKAGRSLFQLEVTGQSSQIQLLHSQRQEYEQLMQELFTMYSTGVLTAPCDGLVTGVDTGGAFLLADTGDGIPVTLLRQIDWHSGPLYELSLLSWPGFQPPSGDGSCGDGTQEEPDDGSSGEDTPEESLLYYAVTLVEADGVTLTKLNTQEVLFLEAVTAYPDGTAIQVGDLVTLSQDGTTIQKIGTSGSGDSETGDMEQTGGMTGSMGGLGSMGGGMGSAVPAFEAYPLDTITVATITSQQEMTLQIAVDEQDIAKIHRGQEAAVTVEALTGQQFPAVVTAIDNTGTNEGGSSKFAVTLTLSKSGDMLPGMNASAWLTLGIQEDVLSIPVAALVEEGTKTLVYTGYDEASGTLTDPVEVTTGVSDGDYVQILSPLSRDTVWYAFYDTPAQSFR